jgi:hypothetical protein
MGLAIGIGDCLAIGNRQSAIVRLEMVEWKPCTANSLGKFSSIP